MAIFENGLVFYLNDTHVKYCDFVLHRHDPVVLAKICPRTHRQTDKHLAINSKSLQKVSLGPHLALMTHTHKLKTLLSQLVQYVPSFFYLLSKQMHVLTRSLPVLFTGGARIDKSWFLVAAFKKQMFLMLGGNYSKQYVGYKRNTDILSALQLK